MNDPHLTSDDIEEDVNLLLLNNFKAFNAPELNMPHFNYDRQDLEMYLRCYKPIIESELKEKYGNNERKCREMRRFLCEKTETIEKFLAVLNSNENLLPHEVASISNLKINGRTPTERHSPATDEEAGATFRAYEFETIRSDPADQRDQWSHQDLPHTPETLMTSSRILIPEIPLVMSSYPDHTIIATLSDSILPKKYLFFGTWLTTLRLEQLQEFKPEFAGQKERTLCLLQDWQRHSPLDDVGRVQHLVQALRGIKREDLVHIAQKNPYSVVHHRIVNSDEIPSQPEIAYIADKVDPQRYISIGVQLSMKTGEIESLADHLEGKKERMIKLLEFWKEKTEHVDIRTKKNLLRILLMTENILQEFEEIFGTDRLASPLPRTPQDKSSNPNHVEKREKEKVKPQRNAEQHSAGIQSNVPAMNQPNAMNKATIKYLPQSSDCSETVRRERPATSSEQTLAQGPNVPPSTFCQRNLITSGWEETDSPQTTDDFLSAATEPKNDLHPTPIFHKTSETTFTSPQRPSSFSTTFPKTKHEKEVTTTFCHWSEIRSDYFKKDLQKWCSLLGSKSKIVAGLERKLDDDLPETTFRDCSCTLEASCPVSFLHKFCSVKITTGKDINDMHCWRELIDWVQEMNANNEIIQTIWWYVQRQYIRDINSEIQFTATQLEQIILHFRDQIYINKDQWQQLLRHKPNTKSCWDFLIDIILQRQAPDMFNLLLKAMIDEKQNDQYDSLTALWQLEDSDCIRYSEHTIESESQLNNPEGFISHKDDQETYGLNQQYSQDNIVRGDLLPVSQDLSNDAKHYVTYYTGENQLQESYLVRPSSIDTTENQPSGSQKDEPSQVESETNPPLSPISYTDDEFSIHC